MKSIFIPQEILDDYELNVTECVVLAIYRYYTVEGEQHCCSMKNEDICKIVRLKNVRNLQRIKQHLKELGYIRTDGGIRVTYIKGRGDFKATPEVTLESSRGDIKAIQRVTLKPSQGDFKAIPGVTLKSSRGDIKATHKKEEKRKKELKKEEKREMTNLDQLLDRLPADYKTPEIVEFIKNNYLDKINQMDFSDGGVIDSCVVVIKSELLKRFTIYPVTDKPVLVKKTDDDDFMW